MRLPGSCCYVPDLFGYISNDDFPQSLTFVKPHLSLPASARPQLTPRLSTSFSPNRSARLPPSAISGGRIFYSAVPQPSNRRSQRASCRPKSGRPAAVEAE